MTGPEFRKQRRSLDISQLAIAKTSGVDISTISRFEKHSIGLKPEQLQRLETALKSYSSARSITSTTELGSRP